MTVHPKYARQRSSAAVALMLPVSILLAACSAENEPQKTEARPVRTITVETRNAGTPITLPGRIEAEDEVALGFRIAGRILENNTRLGDRLKPGQVLARLESQNELNSLRQAKADVGPHLLDALQRRRPRPRDMARIARRGQIAEA